MKKILTFILLVAIAISASAKPKKGANDELNLRIGTYNVWSHSARKYVIKKYPQIEPRNWDASKKAVAELIVKLDCDLLGMHEVTSVCRDDLAELVKKSGGKKYALWWENTYPEGEKNIVGNAIFYNKKKFSLSKQNIYYMSPTPTEPSKGWDEKRHYRAALATVVTHKKTGKKFFFMATHGPLKKEANGHAGRILVEIDQQYNPENLPTIVVGDMNARPGETFHQNMLKHYEDAFLVAEKKCGTIGTFNSSSGTDKNFALSHRRIDQIYVHSTENGKITVKEYTVNRDKYPISGSQYYPSDHCPVYVDVTIK